MDLFWNGARPDTPRRVKTDSGIIKGCGHGVVVKARGGPTIAYPATQKV